MSQLEAILADLNPPQRDAVQTLSGPLLVLAGAGSGKTRVVTRRIAWLIAHGVRPWQMLAVTFTNKAADEMRRRVEDLVGAAGVWLSTFHSFCARLLRREGQALGLSPEYTIYDEEDAQSVLKEISAPLSLPQPRYSAGALRAFISRLKAVAKGPDEVDSFSYHGRIVRQVYEAYQQTLRQNQALDFDDLLLFAVRLLRDHADVRERWRQRFLHLLVDEYQDTNICQYELIKLLGLGHRNVCVTGDPDQSIYAWRGAEVRNILFFEKDFPGAKVVRLEQNYRSTPQILAVAGAVISHNVERKEKGLWTERAKGLKPRLVGTYDAEGEAGEVAARIKRLADGGRPYGHCAIFYRTNAQSRAFEEIFLRDGLPYQLVGGTPFYERREVKDALAYLRLLVNPADDVSFSRVLNVPRRGLGDAALKLIRQEAARHSCSLSDVLAQTGWLEAHTKPRARDELVRFRDLLASWRALPRSPVRPVVERVIQESGLRAALAAAKEEERLANLDELLDAAAAHDARNAPPGDQAAPPATSGGDAVPAPAPAEPPLEPGAFDDFGQDDARRAALEGFLENAALVQPTDTMGEGPDRVTLMTLHMAKGLEFPVVFVVGLEEGLLPLLRRSREDADSGADADAAEKRGVEEERRLFYVGMTRAQEQLFLLHARYRRRFGPDPVARPSRFLDEIPRELVQSEGVGALSRGAQRGDADQTAARRKFWDEDDWSQEPVRPPWFKSRRAGRSAAGDERAPALPEEPSDPALDAALAELTESGLAVGDRVRHPDFGVGVVEELRGCGLSAKARVRFPKAGSKLLLLSMARLKKL